MNERSAENQFAEILVFGDEHGGVEICGREDGLTRQTWMLFNDSLDCLACGKAIENALHGDTRSGNDRLSHHDIGAGYDEVHRWKPTR